MAGSTSWPEVAGIYPNNLIENISEAEWHRVLGINLKGPFLATRQASRWALDILSREPDGKQSGSNSLCGNRDAYRTAAGLLLVVEEAGHDIFRWPLGFPSMKGTETTL
jgi:NAD(P)-dependent dehydrogenase (short-subunit alcohol dehydrogenase family)